MLAYIALMYTTCSMCMIAMSKLGKDLHLNRLAVT